MNTVSDSNASVVSAIPPVVTLRHLGGKFPLWWGFGSVALVATLAFLIGGNLPPPFVDSQSLATFADLAHFSAEAPLGINVDGLITPALPVKTGPTHEEVEADCQTTLTVMHQAADLRFGELKQFFKSLQNNHDAQTSFAESLLSLEAKTYYLTGQGYESWCDAEFRQWIIEPKVLVDAVDNAFQGLCTDLERIRAEQLVRLGIDSDLAPGPAGPGNASLEAMERLVAVASYQMSMEAVDDIPESVARVGLSFLAGETARAATESLAGSSAEAGWLALGVEILAGFAADAAMEELSDPTGRLVEKLKAALTELESEVVQNGSDSNSLLMYMSIIVETHFEVQRQAVYEKLNLRLLPPAQPGE